MSFWKSSGKNSRSLDNFGLSTTQNSITSTKEEFYELELGVVLDIVLDENHPIFSQGTKQHSTIDSDHWPEDIEGKAALHTDKDLTWIGRALVRPLTTDKVTNKDKLSWAFPLEGNISEYPLLNEMVVLVKYNDKLYFTRKINYHNWSNNNLDFGIEPSTSGTTNTELYKNPAEPYKGPISKTKYQGGTNYQGVAGRYFVANNKIRTVKRFEGDLLIESRFGQSIHMLAYDNNRLNDKGDPKNKDYKDSGNPMILIRNKQRPLVKQGQTLKPHDALPPIIGTAQEKNVGGYLEEDINHDGSSIHITSGQTISKWVTTCYKQMFEEGMEEQEAFSPVGCSTFVYPILNGDQIVIQSDRLIFSSRYGETFHYSKKRYGIVTDSEFTIDAHDQIVLTTNVKTVINSPAIYLGEYDETGEPAMLGQTTINWLYELCNWLIEHTHWYVHSHEDAGKETPSQTQVPVQLQKLIALRDSLQVLLSRRVFLTGGGFAPGSDGKDI